MSSKGLFSRYLISSTLRKSMYNHFEQSSRRQRSTFSKFAQQVLYLLCSLFFGLFVSHLRPIGLNALGYQPHQLQRCHLAGGHEGSSLTVISALGKTSICLDTAPPIRPQRT